MGIVSRYNNKLLKSLRFTLNSVLEMFNHRRSAKTGISLLTLFAASRYIHKQILQTDLPTFP